MVVNLFLTNLLLEMTSLITLFLLLHSAAINFQEAKDSIDEEDPRSTSSTWSYITKVVPKLPFELFKGWKPSLKHMHIWRCLSEVRIYNPQEKKLDSRTISGYFIGYAERSKGYRFYCLYHITRIVESRNAKFLENDLINRSEQLRDLGSKIEYIESQPSTSSER